MVVHGTRGKKLQHFYQLVVNTAWDLWKNCARMFRCLALLRWGRTSDKGAMRAIVGSNLCCSLLNSKSPLICIVGKQRKDHKSRSLNYCLFANKPVLFVAMLFLPHKSFAPTGCLRTANCECLWSSRTDCSSSYLLLKIKQFCSSQNRLLFE